VKFYNGILLIHPITAFFLNESRYWIWKEHICIYIVYMFSVLHDNARKHTKLLHSTWKQSSERFLSP